MAPPTAARRAPQPSHRAGRARSRGLAGARGLSLVELMVGIAIGLFIVAAASLVLSAQLGDHRHLRIETQLLQDLRASADIITRELRRAGYWDRAELGLWDGESADVARNAFAPMSPASGPASQVDFRYRRRPGDEGPFGFKLDRGVLKSRIGPAWQELTDSRVIEVTAFTVRVDDPPSAVVPCPRLCADGSQDCWPRLGPREVEVEIRGRAKAAPGVVRRLVTRARLRNDWLRFNDALHPDRVCPT